MQRLSLSSIIGISVAVLIAGGGVAWWTLNAFNSSEQTNLQVQPTPTPTEVIPQQKIEIYWLNATGEEIKLLPKGISVNKSLTDAEVLETAFKDLLAGTKDPNYVSSIPENTRLLSLKIQPDGIHVNLSQEFTTGGGTTSMVTRLAQVIYTASSLDPNSKIWLDIEGKPLEVLGGEGIMVDQPMTRKMIEENFSF